MIKKIISSVKSDNERGARISLIEELFYDFNRSRSQVYAMNFVRGVFFGFGALLGGTVLVALLIWALSMVASWLPFIGDYIDRIIEAIRQTN